MSSFEAATSPSNMGSLLIPPNPAFASPHEHPKGGILLNVGEGSISPRWDAITPPTFSSPLPPTPSPRLEFVPSDPLKPHPPRIRFAPLPQPRPRSLSTGRNLAWTTPGDMDSTEMRHFEIRGVENQQVIYDGDDEDALDDEEGGNESERDKRGRSWSKTMSWKGTKSLLTTGKLLPKDEDDDGYTAGMPLKKSISTGGMIGNSPFRFAAQEERKRSMQGLAARGTSPGHRRGSSLEPPLASSLGSSPQPIVKMLNGRVYGSRRASEIAQAQKKLRESSEPAFVEWGHGKAGSGLGSNAPKSSGGGFLDEEGSGMEWVRRRREERQRKQKEDAQSRMTDGTQSAPEDDRRPHLSSSQSSVESPLNQTLTPASDSRDLPPTPRIEVSEHTPAPAFDNAPPAEGNESSSKAINMPPRPVDTTHSSFLTAPDDDDENNEEEEDDGDFEEDDDEEEEPARTTAAAAGIERVSRHHE